jgi:hypothetical protein
LQLTAYDRVGMHDGAGNLIGIEYRDTQDLKDPGNCAFTTANATCDANGEGHQLKFM